MTGSSRLILNAAITIGTFSMLAVGSVAWVHNRTAARIEANERAELLRALNELIPATEYDNDMLADMTSVTDPLLGSDHGMPIYRARKGGEPVAAALSAVAPDGYAGAIRLLVAVRTDGRLAGVRVVSHKETPGLGDPIEARKSNWILRFNGRSLQNPEANRWAVQKDGGDYDQFTGATITPRAVIRAIRNVLLYVRDHHSAVFGNSSTR